MKVSMCRICLVEDIRMHPVLNTYLQDIYEKLTAMPFQTADGRPLQVCYICHARLRNCHQLQTRCLQSEELFSQVMDICFKPKPLHRMDTLTVNSVVHLNFIPEEHDDKTDEKNDPSDNKDPLDLTYNVSVKVENVDNNTDQEINLEGTASDDHFTIDDINVENDNSMNYQLKTADIINVTNTDEMIGDLAHSIRATDGQDESIFRNINRGSDLKLINSIPTKELRNKICLKPVKVYSDGFGTNAPASKKRKIAKVQESKPTNLPKKPEIAVNCEEIKNIAYEIHVVEESNIEKTANRISTIRKPYKCANYFNREQNLLKHISERPFICDICDKSFNQKHVLAKHICRHVGDRPYSCEICDMCFSRKFELLEHIKVHMIDRQYICDTCKQCFTTKFKLKIHNRIHVGKTPFKCNIM